MIPGSYRLSFEDYLADPCPEPSLSRSSIIDLLDSPARAWWNHPRLNPQPPEPENEAKFDIGSAAHCLLLEGGDAIFIVEGYDDWRTKAAKEARDAARECGKIPLLAKQGEQVFDMAHAAREAIRQCPELGITDLRAEGDSELTYIWQEINGIWCRIRVDWIRKDRTLILDVKTTGTSVNPSIFSSHINKMGYGVQEAFYKRGVKAIEGEMPDFVIMAQETAPPYFCSFHGLDLMNYDMADQKIKWAINEWSERLKSGQWPSYANRVHYAEPKPWELAEWEMRKYEGGGE